MAEFTGDIRMHYFALQSVAVIAALTISFLPTVDADAQTDTRCAAGQVPTLVLGFASLKRQIGDVMGAPQTCEFADPSGTGDIHQRTSTGLAFWRKSTNTPTFTNGWEHWGLTREGLVHWTGSSVDPPATASASELVRQPDAFYADFLAARSMTLVSREEADLTGDGVNETIVKGTGGCGASNCFYSLFIFQGARQVSDAIGTSAATNVQILPGQGLQLVNPVYRPGDGNCCPSGGYAATYVLWEANVGTFFPRDHYP